MLGPLPVPGSLEMKNMQVAPLAGTWQTLHGPVSGTFLHLQAVEELTLVKFLLNTRYCKFDIIFSLLIILIRSVLLLLFCRRDTEKLAQGDTASKERV